MPDHTRHQAAEAAAGLRELADLIDRHPELAQLANTRMLMCVQEQHGDPEPEPVADRFVRLARMLGGQRTKTSDDKYFEISRQFGPIKVAIFTRRHEVCERIVVGTETVEIPDPAAATVTVDREIVRWECKPVLDSAIRDGAS